MLHITHTHEHTIPEMIPLARPGIPSISEKLFDMKYSSQEELSSGPWQNCFQRYVVLSTRTGALSGSKFGPTVLVPFGMDTERQENGMDVTNTTGLPLLPTDNSGEVHIISSHWLFDLQQDGFCTMVVINFMTVDASVSQHAHAADRSRSVSQDHRSSTTGQRCIFGNVKSALTENWLV